jgi:hypothetical protein
MKSCFQESAPPRKFKLWALCQTTLMPRLTQPTNALIKGILNELLKPLGVTQKSVQEELVKEHQRIAQMTPTDLREAMSVINEVAVSLGHARLTSDDLQEAQRCAPPSAPSLSRWRRVGGPSENGQATIIRVYYYRLRIGKQRSTLLFGQLEAQLAAIFGAQRAGTLVDAIESNELSEAEIRAIADSFSTSLKEKPPK